jgi:hypothetical protein
MENGFRPFKFLLFAASVFIRRDEASLRIVPATTARVASRRSSNPSIFNPLPQATAIATDNTVQKDRSSKYKLAVSTVGMIFISRL